MDGRTLSGEPRSPGVYKLSEKRFSGPEGLFALGWQHYVESPSDPAAPLGARTLISRTGQDRGFTTPEDQPVDTGDFIIFRLVAIQLEPARDFA